MGSLTGTEADTQTSSLSSSIRYIGLGTKSDRIGSPGSFFSLFTGNSAYNAESSNGE